MRILLSWADASSEIAELMQELKSHSHEVVYWIGHEGGERYKLPETIFHFYQDAIDAKPTIGVSGSNFNPPGKDLLEKLHKTESLVLTMMNRLFDRSCVDERRHIYYNMIQYWLGVLNEYKPEIIIFPNMPHFVYDFIIYELAHFLDIRTLVFDDTRISGRLLFFNDLHRGSERLQQELEKNKGCVFNLDDLSEDIQRYCRPRMEKDYDRVPQYIVDRKIKHPFLKWLISDPKVQSSVKNLSFVYKAPRYLYEILRQKRLKIIKKPLQKMFYKMRYNLKDEYNKVQVKPDLSRDFIYFALHNQPERSTSPQGGMFVDQILVIETISSSLPDGWVLYVKEHPVQWIRTGLNFSSSRYRGYYENIANIKNVFLVPEETSSYELIKKAKIVTTVTGAVAWEAALQLKPSIIFGTVWYQDCPGIFRVNGVDSCRRAIHEIRSGFEVDRKKLVSYLKCFDNATIRGFTSPFAGKEAGMNKSESLRNMCRQILKEAASLGFKRN